MNKSEQWYINENLLTQNTRARTYTAPGRGFDPRVRQHSFVEIGLGIISTAIIFLVLIQVGQLSVTGERMCT